MKKKNLAALIFSAFLLCACGAEQPQQESAGDEPPPVQAAEPIYGFEESVREEIFFAEDGRMVSSYRYEIPLMTLVNADKLSAEQLEMAERNQTAFNKQMQQIMDEAVAFGTEMAQDMDIQYLPMMPAADEKTLTAVQTGEIVTVCAQCYFYGGGAHPNSYALSYIFDLTLGQFIDPTQIGDDPELFRAQVAQMLVDQAESLGEEYTLAFWNDYAEIISRWNETTVLFEKDGMKVVYSPYELGPYAMGFVELFLTYEELADVIGPGGLAHLGITVS